MHSFLSGNSCHTLFPGLPTTNLAPDHFSKMEGTEADAHRAARTMRNDEEKQTENSDTRQSVKGLTETHQDSYQNLRSLRPHHDIQHDGLHRLVGLIPSPSLPTFCLECHPTHLFAPRDPPKYQPKAGLDDLPAELILQIFQDCDPDGILALTAVSPRCSGVFRNYGAEVIINLIARLRDKISCPTAYTTHDVFDSLCFSPKGRKSSSTPTWHIYHNAYRFGYKDMMGCFPEDAEGSAPNRYFQTTNRTCKAQVGDQRFCRCDWVASSLPSDLKSLGVLFELADNLQNRNYELPLARAAQVDWHWMSHPRYNVLLYVLGLSDEWYWCTCVCEPDLCTCPMVGPGDSSQWWIIRKITAAVAGSGVIEISDSFYRLNAFHGNLRP